MLLAPLTTCTMWFFIARFKNMVQRIRDAVRDRSMMVYFDKKHDIDNDYLKWFANNGDLQSLENFLQGIIDRDDYVSLLQYIP